MRTYLIHYSEIGLKGRNRSMFEDQLIRNVYRCLRGLGRVAVRRLFGRFRLDIDNEENVLEAEARLSRVFGIAYYAPVQVYQGFELDPLR